MSRFVIACGGTGGHLSPGIAIAESLSERGHGCVLVVSRKDVDSRLLRKYPKLSYVKLPGAGFSKRPRLFLRFVLGELRGIAFAFRFLHQEKPACIVGFGGFITATMALAGFILGYPVVLHEANRRPGRTTRVLSGLAQRIYLPPGVRLKSLPAMTGREMGFPVRREIRRLPVELAREKLEVPRAGKLLVVLGGSQGAHALNAWVAEAFGRLAEAGVNVLCLCGPARSGEGTLRRTGQGGESRVAVFKTFCDEMAAVFSSADLIVSRAGAGSIAEIIRCGVPAILVPFPFAADNHQEANARYVERQGAAIVVEQDKLDSLTREVLDTIGNDWLLQRMRDNLSRMDEEDVSERMAEDIEKVASESAEVSA